jgi:hypothetical protein
VIVFRQIPWDLDPQGQKKLFTLIIPFMLNPLVALMFPQRLALH